MGAESEAAHDARRCAPTESTAPSWRTQKKRGAVALSAAHRGEEITDEVLDAPNSLVWRQVFHRRSAMIASFGG